MLGLLSRFSSRQRLVAILLVLFLIGLAAVPSVYFYRKYQALVKTAASVSSEGEAEQLVKKVDKHILLPQNETPTVFTVTDKDKLSGQQFFANSKNGDKVLVYNEAKKAFLYDPIADKVLEVGPVLSASPTPAPSEPVTPTPTELRFVLYNGTATNGLTRKYETELSGKIAGATIVDRDNAKVATYEKTILIDLIGTNASQAQTIAQSLGIEVSDLPEGEIKPTDADFLIIVGKDKE